MSNINIHLDGICYTLRVGDSIFDAVNALGLTGNSLNTRPLAAQIAGEVYALDYRPKSACDVVLLRYGTEAGKRIYECSAKFILLCSLHNLYGNITINEQYSLGGGIHFNIDKDIDEHDIENIRHECKRIISLNLPFVRTRLSVTEAKKYFTENGQTDKAELLSWREHRYFDVYSIDDSGYKDYFYCRMLPSTGYLTVFSINRDNNAIIMCLPLESDPNVCADYVFSPKLAYVFKQSDEWGRLMACDTVSDLNRLVRNGKLKELIRVNEALHERSYASLADRVAKKHAKAVFIAGPSSSGKTTSANRLATQLRAIGLSPIMLSLDNYYRDRTTLVQNEYGEIDLEHLNALDTARFSADLTALMAGDTVEIPVFNFHEQTRDKHGTLLQAGIDHPIIIEGIHGLNPELLGKTVDSSRIYKIYVSALTTLNLDNHNRIRTTDVRLLRRIVRDYATRSASMEHTLSMWASVQRGERTWIFPFQENADEIFNTTLVYELAILKKYVYDLLEQVQPNSVYYLPARAIVKVLNYFQSAPASVECEIPPTSVLREFIGGNVFYD